MPESTRTRPHWWALTWRYGVCCLVWLGFVGLWLGATTTPEVASPARMAWWVVDLVIGAGMILAMRWRRRHPWVLAWVMTVLTLVCFSGVAAATWAYMHACTSRRWRRVLPLAAASVLGSVLAEVLHGWGIGALPQAPRSAVDLLMVGLFGVPVMAAITAIAFYVGARRDLMASLVDRAETAEREQESRALQAQAEERNRIAREMHDVLAHRLSLVSMHAGALAYRQDLPAEQVRETAAVIQENVHASLSELRGVLGQLRDPSSSAEAPQRPQPTWCDLPALFDEARAAGTRLEVVDAVEDPDQLPVVTGRHAYRVAQELLTNARKHAPLARQTIELSGRPGDGLSIVARNPLQNGRTPVPGAGMGLLGLAERAQVVGGRLSRREADGVFEVRVWFPW